MQTTMSLIMLRLLVSAASGQTVIVDNADAGFTQRYGAWNTGSFGVPYGANYNWGLTSAAGGAPAEAVWRPILPHAGDYEVAVHYVSGANRALDAPYTVHHLSGTITIDVNQRENSSTWVPLGVYSFDAGTSGLVTLANAAGPTVVIADAVRFRSAEGLVLHDDPRIRIGGAFFARPVNYALRLDRLSPELLADPDGLFSPTVAVLTTGVTVRFRTASPTVRATFNHLSSVVTEGTGYAVFQNGAFNELVSDLEVVDIASAQPGAPVTFEIVCPSYDEVTLADLRLEPGADLLPLPADRRPRYVAFGDSITHGSQLDFETKADSTTSYPWLLASARGWELYNLAVGGSQVSPAFGDLLVGQHADLITILWGLNDKSRDNDLGLFITRYGALLDNLRAAQPATPIYCITMIACGSEGPGSNGYTLYDYRDAVADIVAARQAAGDCHLHLIHGDSLTTLADLADGAHFSVAGAARFAAQLADVIGAPWGDINADGVWNAADGQILAACLSGPAATPSAETCEALDVDCDSDVDLREFWALQQRCSP
jgi:lysophospholipase L1-like esterase